MAQGLFLILILLTVTEITCNTYRKTNASTQINKTKEGRKMKKTPAIEGIQNRLYVQYKNKTCLCLHDNIQNAFWFFKSLKFEPLLHQQQSKSSPIK